jgi:hypothetical protein
VKNLLSFTLILFTACTAFSQEKIKTLDRDQAQAVINLYTQAEEAEKTFKNASQVLDPSSSPCFRQALAVLEKEAQYKAVIYFNTLLSLRIELEVPKDWVFDLKTTTFSPPAQEQK